MTGVSLGRFPSTSVSVGQTSDPNRGVTVTNPLSADQLLRFESLGDNCEFGFVLRKLGCESGSLFRWAAMTPDQLLDTLRANFEGMYRFENLTPLRTGMVLDSAYGIGWHSELKSTVVDGRLVFRDDEDTRRRFHHKERRKLHYLLSKFIGRAKLGGIVFVIKSNEGIAPATLDGILDTLRALVDHAAFALLEVQESDDPVRIGTVEWQRPGLLRGYVSRFAPYQKADDIDADAWFSILDGAVRLFPCPDWSQRLAGLHVGVVDATVQLGFPFDPSQDLSKPIMGDRRAGMVSLLHGNDWCRQVGDSFRLHGPGADRPGTTLRWTDVQPPGPFQLSGTVNCPIRDSVPLQMSVRISGDDGVMIAEQRLLIQAGRAEDIVVASAAGGRPVIIEITVNAARTLNPGERAVVDLSPPMLHPDVPMFQVPVSAAAASEIPAEAA